MALPSYDLNTIALDPPEAMWVIDENFVASEVITPGSAIELHLDSGVIKWRNKSTEDENPSMVVALNDPLNNKGIEDAYAVGDVVRAGWLGVGYVWQGIATTSEVINECSTLEFDNAGTMKLASDDLAATNVYRAMSLTDTGGAASAGERIICIRTN